MRNIDRRTVLGLSSLALAGCAADGPYFGNTQPPAGQDLTCAVFAGTGTLDPAKTSEFITDGQILRTLFEGLTTFHPVTAEPMAGIATHYETSADGMRVTLYLRGHTNPGGAALPTALNRTAPRPARWTDGSPVTAHDVVYSFRRVLDPETASPCAYLLYPIANAESANAGRISPDRLGVRALDEFTVQIDLRAPTAFFLRLLSSHTAFPVPRQAIEPARRRGKENTWTDPSNILTSGPFRIREWRPRDIAVLERNPHYHDADMVRLDRVSFLLTADVTVGTNLYKYGRAHLTNFRLPPYIARMLAGKRDLKSVPAFGIFYPCFNVRRPPFDNVLLRYAFNMATDKKAIADVFGFGRQPARTVVPPLPGYTPPWSLPVKMNGRDYDVLEFNVRAARELLAAAGFPEGRYPNGAPLKVGFLYPALAPSRLHAEIIQQQWRANLGVEMVLTDQEFNAWIQNAGQFNYTGITDNQDWGYYLDPNWFLEEFTTGSGNNWSGWTDPQYESMLATANATLDPEVRMQKLAQCEAHLLRAMPCIPEYYDVWAYPQKPFVRGISTNIMDVHPLKYAWIDTDWRPPV